MGEVMALSINVLLNLLDVPLNPLNPSWMKRYRMAIPTGNVNHRDLIRLGNQFGVTAHIDV
jgi:hypothetical protein